MTIFVAILGLLGFGGLVAAVTRKHAQPSLPSDGAPRINPADIGKPPVQYDPGVGTGYVPGPERPPGAQEPTTVEAYEQAVTGIDLANPGVKESIARLRLAILEQPEKTQATVRRFAATAKAFQGEIDRRRLIELENAEKARTTLAGIETADAVFSEVKKIPYVGEIINGVYQVARPFAVAKAKADANGDDLFSSNWKAGGEPNFTGWQSSITGESGDYFLKSVPILSFAAPIMVYPFISYSESYTPPMQCLLRLTKIYPFGPPVGKVSITDSGQFNYQFNPWVVGDISQAEIDAQHVFSVDVWNPLDISPTGPRNFDRKNPRAWRESAAQEAQAKGWLDPKRSPYYTEG